VQGEGDRLEDRLDHPDGERRLPVPRERVGDAERHDQVHQAVGQGLLDGLHGAVPNAT
jgi:hypothetical protein